MMSLHTINIPIPSQIIEQIQVLFNELNQNYRNKYFADQNWNPHISLLTTQISEENSIKYIKEAEQIAKGIQEFEIKLDLLLPSPNYKYIWINVDQNSKKRLIEIHNKFQTGLEKYRNKDIPQYFQNKWDHIPEKVKIKIVRTGGIHDYFPHLSIVKLPAKETRKAILKLDRKKFKETQFKVSNLEITKQSFDPKDMFPIVKTLNLKKLIS